MSIEERNEKTHPSYGKIKIGSFTCNGGMHFYGSEVSHNGGVSITISRSMYERNLANNWYFSGDRLIEIRLSANQFAELITMGMNSDGVPCTLISVNGERQEEFVPESTEEMFKKDYSERIERASTTFKDATTLISEMLSGKTVKKADLEKLKGMMNSGIQNFDSNREFVKEQFGKYMDNAFTELKVGAEHYLDTGLKRLGLEALKDSIGQISNNDTTGMIKV